MTGSSFGYSSCLKWGYAGSIDVAAFNVQQAADVLGLDLTKVGLSALTMPWTVLERVFSLSENLSCVVLAHHCVWCSLLDGSSASLAFLFHPGLAHLTACVPAPAPLEDQTP